MVVSKLCLNTDAISRGGKPGILYEALRAVVGRTQKWNLKAFIMNISSLNEWKKTFLFELCRDDIADATGILAVHDYVSMKTEFLHVPCLNVR